jgi:hypothetical protein
LSIADGHFVGELPLHLQEAREGHSLPNGSSVLEIALTTPMRDVAQFRTYKAGGNNCYIKGHHHAQRLYLREVQQHVVMPHSISDVPLRIMLTGHGADEAPLPYIRKEGCVRRHQMCAILQWKRQHNPLAQAEIHDQDRVNALPSHIIPPEIVIDDTHGDSNCTCPTTRSSIPTMADASTGAVGNTAAVPPVASPEIDAAIAAVLINAVVSGSGSGTTINCGADTAITLNSARTVKYRLGQ